MHNKTMRSLPDEMQPYQRLECLGAQRLSDAELVSILLKSGSRGRMAVDVANEVLRNSGGISGIGNMSVGTLSKIAGVGRIKAITLLAAYELGVRTTQSLRAKKLRITGIEQIAEEYVTEMSLLKREEFRVLLLDKRWGVIKEVTVSVGTVDHAIVSPREVFAEAVANYASGIVLIHNHPSGDVTPSRIDVNVTRSLLDAAWILGIEIADHLIIGGGEYYSFVLNGEFDKLREEALDKAR